MTELQLGALATQSVGFIQAPVERVADEMVRWRSELYHDVSRTDVHGGLSENLHLLEPLTKRIRPRHLLVQTANPEWAAVTDCGADGSDPSPVVGYLAEVLSCSAITVTYIPEATTPESPFGARQFEVFAPTKTDFINYLRTVSLTQDDDGWYFEANGEIQPFEDPRAYGKRRKVDRLTKQMIVDYANAFGLRPFDDDFYSGPAVLVQSQNPA